jgi:hypothetical protein
MQLSEVRLHFELSAMADFEITSPGFKRRLSVETIQAAQDGFAPVRSLCDNRRKPTFSLRHDLAVSRPSAPGPVIEPDEFSCVHVCPGSAQRGLSDRKEIGTANHAEHAKGSGALQGQDDAFDLKARLAEVE